MPRPLALLLLLLISSPLLGQQQLAVDGGFARGTEAWNVPQSPECAASVVPAQVGEYAQALRLVLRPRAGAAPWAINLNQPVDGSLRAGDRLQLRVWLRSPQRCRLAAYLEIAREPYTKSLSATATLTPEWREYVFEGKCLQDYLPEQANVGFHLGYDAGTVEMTGARLIDLDAQPEAEGARPTMEQPISLISNGDFSSDLRGSWGEGDGQRLRATLIAADVAGFTRAVRLECNPPADARPWDVGFGQACTAGVRKGDTVYFRAWLRSPDSARVSFIYELSAAPNTKYIAQPVTLTPEWREYRFAGFAASRLEPGQHQAKFFLGYGKATIEVAGVRVTNHGPAPLTAFSQTIDYWGGRPHPDDWRQPALERIERIRKGDLTVRVLDAQGRPVPGATVRVQQQRHYFRFGTAAPAGRFLDTVNPDNLRFRQEVARLFNTVTFENDLKWGSRGDGSLRTQLQAAQWLKEHGLDLRGHCLVWGSYKHLPAPERDLRGAALREAIAAHVTDYSSRMRGKLYLWDVVNEAGSNTEVWDEVGWEAFADVYRRARVADPDVRLCYNDYNIAQEDPGYRSKVARRVQYLLDAGVPLEVLGDQAHMSLPLTPIDRVLQIWDEWGRFGKDLEITEFDLGCPDDRIHGEYVRDFLIAAFSHPKITSFIQWGFWEGSHWRAKDSGAMFRRDWSKRPAQEAYEALVLDKWWTRWQGTAAVNGEARLRAFYGRHQVTVEAGGRVGSALLDLTPGKPGSVEVRLR